MNVNLGFTPTDVSRDPRPVSEHITEHQAVMTGAGFPLTGRVALVAEDQEALPGSYRVWLDTYTNKDLNFSGRWVWVDDEGVVHRDTRPLSHVCDSVFCGA